jgi:hypothetical protein
MRNTVAFFILMLLCGVVQCSTKLRSSSVAELRIFRLKTGSVLLILARYRCVENCRPASVFTFVLLEPL